MSLVKEFKEFAMRGNVVDLAVGVVIGAAFGKVVGSLVEKIVMPITGYLTGGVDFKDRTVTLPVPELAEGMKPPQIGWGAFAQSVIDFVIVALAIFLVVKAMNALRKKAEKGRAAQRGSAAAARDPRFAEKGLRQYLPAFSRFPRARLQRDCLRVRWCLVQATPHPTPARVTDHSLYEQQTLCNRHRRGQRAGTARCRSNWHVAVGTRRWPT